MVQTLGSTSGHWSAKSNKTYQVVKSLDLLGWTNALAGAGACQQSRQTVSTNGVLKYIDPASSSNTKAFYRLDLAE